MKKIRFGINPLAFFAGITLIISMLFPWWTLEVSVMPRPTDIYPYLVDGPASEIIGYQRSPQMTVLFILLLVCIALLLIGSFVKGKAITISNTTAGVLVILAVWRFLIRIGGVADLYEVPIQGHGIGNYGGFAFVDVYTTIQLGIFLAIIAAVAGVLAGFFHKKLSNKFSLNWITNDESFSDELSNTKEFSNNENGG